MSAYKYSTQDKLSKFRSHALKALQKGCKPLYKYQQRKVFEIESFTAPDKFSYF